MRLFKVNPNKRRSGQMFILATMLIAVYIVTMAAALMSLGSHQIFIDRGAINEPYLNSKYELQNFIELVLADYSKNGSTLTNSEAADRINNFISQMEILNSERGIISDFTFNTNTFNISANRFPHSNVTSSAVYSSQIYAEFDLIMNTIDSSFIIEESFFITFKARAEIQGNNKVIVEQSKGIQFMNIDVAYISIFNGSTYVPSSDPVLTGYYTFEGIPDLNNFGILNVTLLNSVSIFS